MPSREHPHDYLPVVTSAATVPFWENQMSGAAAPYDRGKSPSVAALSTPSHSRNVTAENITA
jgi:hypothetical protein